MSFSYDGAYLATTSKDKYLRVLDARTGQIVSQGLAHDGSKASRAVFLGTTNKVLTTGVSKSSERQLAVWDPVSSLLPACRGFANYFIHAYVGGPQPTPQVGDG